MSGFRQFSLSTMMRVGVYRPPPLSILSPYIIRSSSTARGSTGGVSGANEGSRGTHGGSRGRKRRDKEHEGDPLTPRRVVEELDKYIVGQEECKRAVAIAYRNRWRRSQLPQHLQADIVPKNILMIGSTGCGKTEIARRLAKLADAPFVRTDATKFTEVGFVGQDVNEIISELVNESISRTKKQMAQDIMSEANTITEKIIVGTLQHQLKKTINVDLDGVAQPPTVTPRPNGQKHGSQHAADALSEEAITARYRDGEYDDEMILVDLPVKSEATPVVAISSDQGSADEAALDGFMRVISQLGSRSVSRVKKRMKVSTARDALKSNQAQLLFSEKEGDITREALKAVEEKGIVFIDEIDKVVSGDSFSSGGRDASAEGVQRDLLPLVEGTVVNTKKGNINTEYILFIAAGSFHSAKPSDLLPELQGRLPIRVNLAGLTENDLYRILTEPVNNLLKQQVELMKSESVSLTFTEKAIREIAKIASEVNRTVENIGARRLHTVVERIMEEISFSASETPNTSIEIDEVYVREKTKDYLSATDLNKYII